VVYAGIADCGPVIELYGFEFLPVFERWFPAGFTRSRQDVLKAPPAERMASAKAMFTHMNAFFAALARGEEAELGELIARIDAGVCVISACVMDSIVWALLAHTAGARVLYLQDTFAAAYDPGVPPVTCDAIPAAGIVSRVERDLAWARVAIRRFCFRRIFERMDRLPRWYQTIDALARRARVQVDCNRMYIPRIQAPEIRVLPPELDFPARRRIQALTAECSVDLDRPEPDFPMEWLDPGRPLVLCALGALNWTAPEQARTFFAEIAGQAAKLTSTQWIIAAGPHAASTDAGTGNVRVVHSIPQLRLLRRASCMIHHAGANSFKECALFGVPMVLLPAKHDAFGNAARGVFHGIAVRDAFPRTGGAGLADVVRRVLDDPAIRTRSQAMSRRLLEVESASRAVDFVEAQLDSSARKEVLP
jgi:UDP:flavonoid glycosyltransferase YjiC (YdhE family)